MLNFDLRNKINEKGENDFRIQIRHPRVKSKDFKEEIFWI